MSTKCVGYDSEKEGQKLVCLKIFVFEDIAEFHIPLEPLGIAVQKYSFGFRNIDILKKNTVHLLLRMLIKFC